ncbi:MAG TPA: 2OG-Fe(II) oxygenase [Myxococcota bacterium]|nr:2OG-Fe(II) oxygenase [Myxococcota bacterium]
MTSAATIAQRVAALDWPAIRAQLDSLGCASAGTLLEPAECRALRELYRDDARFRSTVDMTRHRYGEGEYRYFDRPLPRIVEELRGAFYPRLLAVAREWAERLGRPGPWPDAFEDWLAQCHDAGQKRPTPLLLRYEAGGWNALHRDLYGELVFPLQVVIGLDEPGVDYQGGELVVVEQRPRAQSRATTLTIGRGEAVVFTTRDRPLRGARGWLAAPMRHGVSVLRSGERHTLGLIFHDAT